MGDPNITPADIGCWSCLSCSTCAACGISPLLVGGIGIVAGISLA